MPTTRLLIGSFAFFVAAAALPFSASADWVAQASAGCRLGSDNDADSSIGFAPAQADAQFVGRSGAHAEAVVVAGGGAVAIFADANAVGLGRESTESDGCASTASGSATSLIFIDTPIVGSGTASVTIDTTGVLSGESSGTVYSSGAVSWGIRFGNQGRSGTEALLSRFGNESRSTSGSSLGTHTFSVAVDFDTWVPLTVSAAVNLGTFEYGAIGGTFIPGTTSMSAQFFNTFEFLGINELRDSAGNLVEFTAFDQDGRNYRIGAIATPVPEPASWALFGAGLCALSALRRRALFCAAPS